MLIVMILMMNCVLNHLGSDDQVLFNSKLSINYSRLNANDKTNVGSLLTQHEKYQIQVQSITWDHTFFKLNKFHGLWNQIKVDLH